jgi:HK97 family phage major capsid protein/HK97 family phage prohead protease
MSEFIEVKAALQVDDAGEITGVAWPFGSPDRVGDVITKGAFASTPARLPMLWSHDQSAVIGVWDSIDETPAGLQVKGRLLINSVEKAREVRALVTAGAVNGLSIGFKTKQAAPRKGGGRVISALDLCEVSIVAVPSHPDARIQTIKSATKGKTMENELNEEIETKTIDAAEVEEKFTSLETKLADLGALGSRLDRLEARLNRPGAPAIITKQADAAEIEKKAFSNWARARVTLDTKALSVAGTGGVTVPTPLMSELIRNIVLYSPIRSVARVMSVGAETVTLPKRTTNLAAGHVTETAARSESTPTYTSQTIATHEIAVYSDVSIKMLEDSVFDLASYLMEDIGIEFGRLEGATLVNGTGVDQARGILHSPAAGSIVNAVGPTIAPDDLIELFHSLPGVYANNGTWLMNRKTIGAIRKLKTTTGEYLWQDSFTKGNPPTILGAPVLEIPDAPDIAPSTISVAFGDMQQAYRVLDRVSIEMLRDDFTQRAVGSVRFHARRRYGGDIVKPEAIRYLKTTAS